MVSYPPLGCLQFSLCVSRLSRLLDCSKYLPRFRLQYDQNSWNISRVTVEAKEIGESETMIILTLNNIINNLPSFLFFLQLCDITSIIIMRLSELVRRSVVEPPLRKKISGVNMQNRKEIRRIRKLNVFSRQLTGQQNDHGWFTPRRFKALGTFLQTCRNAHPGTLPIKPELKKQIGEKFLQDSHWSYYVFRNYLTQIQVQEQIKKKTVNNDEISQLPAHFRDQFSKQQTPQPLPKLANPFFIYNAQTNVFLPQDERYRINLLFKLENPPENKDQEQRKEAKERGKQE